MNKAQLRQRTRQLSGAELDGLRSDEEVDLLVEEAYMQVGSLLPWRWREVTVILETVDGEPEYDLPAGVDEPRGFTVLNARGHNMPVALKEVPVRDLLTRIRRDDEHLPRFYARFGDRRIRFGPVPDSDYDIEVYGLAPLQGLENDTDTPEWDARFHAPVAYMASSVLLDEEGQEELALHRRGRAEELLTEMIEHYQQSKDHTPIVMGGGQAGVGLGRNPWLD